MKIEFWKTCDISGNINKCSFFILNNKMCNHMEDLHSSVNQYFPNDQFMVLQNHTWVKELFRV